MQAAASKPQTFARVLVRDGQRYRRVWSQRRRRVRRDDELSHEEILALHREMGAALGRLLEAET